MWLKEYRKKINKTQLQIANEVGITRQMIAALEKGAKPSVKTAKKIGQVMGFDWKLFFD